MMHIRRVSALALALGLGTALDLGYGCAAAWADPWGPSSARAWTLVDFASSDFTQVFESSPSAVTASTDLISNDFGLAAAAVSSDSANPLSAAADDLWSELLAIINGVSPTPSTPGDFVGYSGDPSLLQSVANTLLDLVQPFEKLLGIDFTSEIAPFIASASPPAWLESLAGITVTETTYDGMPVYDLTPVDPSGQYVVAIHGGAWVDQPTIVHWLSYTDMAHETGATVVVPIYPLATDGGTASVVVPEISNLISSEIATEGADHVSVTGDSAGGGIALSAVELLVSEDKPVPDSMVLDSPGLDASFSNPDISVVDDPVLNLAESQQDGLLWAGDLPLTNPLVSPIYGSLEGLPPTYVYSGSDEIIAPDTLKFEQDAIAQDAPISFILRTGEIHDWALLPLLDGAQVQTQIYQELGLTDASSSAVTSDANAFGALESALQTLGTDLSSNSLSSGLGDLSTDVSNVFTALSTELTDSLATISTGTTALSGDLSALAADVLGWL